MRSKESPAVYSALSSLETTPLKPQLLLPIGKSKDLNVGNTAPSISTRLNVEAEKPIACIRENGSGILPEFQVTVSGTEQIQQVNKEFASIQKLTGSAMAVMAESIKSFSKLFPEKPLFSDQFLRDVLNPLRESAASVLNGIISEMQPFTGIDNTLFDMLNKQATQIRLDFGGISNSLTETSSMLRELFGSIKFDFTDLDAAWRKLATGPLPDIFLARGGDVSAAVRLADRISWSPNPQQREAIRLRARIAGKLPDEVRREALIQGVLLTLAWNEDAEFPVLVGPESKWVYDSDKSLLTICPQELPISVLWSWFREEAARAAGLWLFKHPYGAAFVVMEAPIEYWDLRLVEFTSGAENYQLEASRGRPFGSGVFQNREAFLNEIRFVVAQIRSRGNRVTQERVADALSGRGLVGSAQPVSQLRRWTKEFGFVNWADLLTQL